MVGEYDCFGVTKILQEKGGSMILIDIVKRLIFIKIVFSHEIFCEAHEFFWGGH